MTDSLPHPPRLDPRLSLVASLVPKCHIAADIGADHGKLSAFLLMSGRCDRMIVSDISKVSRQKARDLFVEKGILKQVIQSGENGLHALSEPVDCIIICGMGGKLIAEILAQPVNLHGAKLILSAQSDLHILRDAIVKKTYCIQQEYIIKSSGRFYRVIETEQGEDSLTESERLLGKNLNRKNQNLIHEYLNWQLQVSKDWRNGTKLLYRQYIKEALKIYGCKPTVSNH